MLKPLTLRQARKDSVSHADSSLPSSTVAPPPPDVDSSAQHTYNGQQQLQQQQQQQQQQESQFAMESSNQMDVDDVGSDDRSRRATSVLSLDDIEAAQALEGLRSEYTHPSSARRDTNQATAAGSGSSESEQAEPLLSLLTTSHPLLSSAINGSMSVYTSSKSYSPRFRYGAEFIERNIGSRVVNTVGTVGKKTGVEGGIRWALQRRDGSDGKAQAGGPMVEPGSSSTPPDIEKGLPTSASSTRRSSDISGVESLPPYEMLASRSNEDFPPPDSKMEEADSQLLQQQQPGTWPSRLMISTSGLGVAMSEESLRSLTYCLTWLRWANTRLGNSVVSLKQLLEEWDAAREDEMSTDNPNYRPRSPSALSQQIQQVKGDVLQTLKVVVDVVSKYAGGALPENARNLVRRHLTSLPQRFRLASSSNLPADGSIPQSEMATRAHRVLVLAEEGLDMMGQVSVVVNDTLVSAESWCDRLRRPKPTFNPQGREEYDPEQPPLPPRPLENKPPMPMPEEPQSEGDVEMTGVSEKT